MFDKMKRRIPTNDEYIRQQKYKAASKEDLIHEIKHQRNCFLGVGALLMIAIYALIIMTVIATSNLSEDTADKLTERTELLSKRLCFEIGGEYIFYAINQGGYLFVTCDNGNFTSTLVIEDEQLI